MRLTEKLVRSGNGMNVSRSVFIVMALPILGHGGATRGEKK
jgi:hypothetical protein